MSECWEGHYRPDTAGARSRQCRYADAPSQGSEMWTLARAAAHWTTRDLQCDRLEPGGDIGCTWHPSATPYPNEESGSASRWDRPAHSQAAGLSSRLELHHCRYQ